MPFTRWFVFHIHKLRRVGFHDWVMLFATIAIAISTIVYTHYAKKQWKAMDEQKGVMQGQLDQMKTGAKQTDQMISATNSLAATSADQLRLMRAQLVGSQGDTLRMQARVDDRGLTVYIDRPTVDGVAPPMRIRAKDVDIAFVATVRSIADRKTIGVPVTFRQHIPTLSKEAYYVYRIPVPDYSAGYAAGTLDRFVTMRGTFRYDNGFGDLIKEDICIGYFGYKTKRGEDRGGSCDCSILDASLRDAMDQKRKEEAAPK